MWEGLKPFNTAGLKQINPKKAAAAVDAGATLDADRVLQTSYERHRADHVVRSRAARKVIGALPVPGEVLHVLMSGTFDGWDFVEAVLTLAAPATIAELYVATLGFGEKNAGQLLQQLDAGRIGRVWFVASCYMRDKHGDKFARLSEMLTKRGHAIRATRNHAKIIAMRLTDGRTYCIDGSLNLCACRNVEQAHVWADDDLFAFYSAYVREQTAGGRVK